MPNIFKDRSVTSAIPAYLKNTEAPKNINKTNLLGPLYLILIFNKLVPDLNIHANTEPDPIARSDARPPSIQADAGSILFFRGDCYCNNFYCHVPPIVDSSSVVVSRLTA